ncbi:MAG: Glu-tRNA(Gln) amidotransferase subunit GatE [Thermoanaerobaculales bacterium]|nr:Glu-tRNA(Gln) amidotransferase subunit GatE [Thermoanaerobaculales bacterium]
MRETIDYAAVGLMVGLEVHQQLLTDKKMFCHCPAGLYTTEHDGSVLRHMRPTLSELGEYDGTALMEFKTRKNIVYLLHRSNTCTYEMDDTPPFLVNQQSLDVAIEQCLMLGCDIVDEVHIARKQYLDGSIPTGFQRTAIVGVNGRLPFRGREISITQVSVEEDSCREVSDRGHLIVWRTDRLGMPLIETVTGPDLRTPEEVEEAILLVGRVCRSTGHVRVGIGASRQDVNVSVRGGRRVEIKGVPKAGWAPGLVHGEAVRQVNLLALRDELRRRGFADADALRVDHRDVTGLVQGSTLEVLKRATWELFLAADDRRPGFERGAGTFSVRVIALRGLAGVPAWPTQPDRTFADELKGRVRVIAGLDQPPTLLHSEAWPPAAAAELERLRGELGCGDGDAIVVVWGAEQDTLTAAEEIRLRLVDALDGVPHETRQPFADGHTDFERILPGPDRMYPDTDSPPQRVTRERVDRLRAPLPEPPWVREQRYTAAGVPRPVIHYLIRRGGARLVDELVGNGADPRRACFFVGERLKGLRRAGVAVDRIAHQSWVELFTLAGRRSVLWEATDELVRWLAENPGHDLATYVQDNGLGEAPDGWRDRVVELATAARPDHPDGTPDQRLRFLLGLAMTELRGRVPAAEVTAAVRAEIGGQR